MITGNKNIIDNVVDLFQIGIVFSSKPVIFGGLAMEYYGLRKHEHDIDLFITHEDYEILANKYPNNKKDRWGDFGLTVGKYELWRSVCKLDYSFYAEGAIEYETYKVLSFEKLFFTKVIAYENEPEVQKHTDDYKLVINHYYNTYKNREYEEFMIQNSDIYLSIPDGIVYNDNY